MKHARPNTSATTPLSMAGYAPDAEDVRHLVRLLGELQLDVPEDRVSQILVHTNWVLERNKTLNLTAITDRDQAIRLHALDSLVALPEIAESPEGMLCDLGSGGGFPGVPLAIATGRETTLVDSVAKKMNALAEFIAGIGAEGALHVMPGRAEEITDALGGRCAAVTFRAVSPLPSLVELGAPFLINGGRLIALKGAVSEEELARAHKVADLVGLRLVGCRRLALPEGGETRSIVSFERVGTSRVKIPRRTGLAQKRPLA